MAPENAEKGGLEQFASDLKNFEGSFAKLWAWLRSSAQTVEVIIDALAHEAGRDAVEFRLAMLKAHPRHSAVLKLAAEKGGWGEKLTPGRGRGIAVHESSAASWPGWPM